MAKTAPSVFSATLWFKEVFLAFPDDGSVLSLPKTEVFSASSKPEPVSRFGSRGAALICVDSRHRE
jgi:hypothetical protein